MQRKGQGCTEFIDWHKAMAEEWGQRGLAIELFQGPHRQPSYHWGKPLWCVSGTVPHAG